MELLFRRAEAKDVDLYYTWTNEDEVRKNSFSNQVIVYDDHVKWFGSKIVSPSSVLLIFFAKDSGIPVGQVRFENQSMEESIIGISIDKEYRGMGLAQILLDESSSYFHELFPDIKITAYIKKENISSLKSFRSAGFLNETACFYLGTNSIKLSKYD